MASVTLEKVKKDYGVVRVLNEVDLKIADGEFVVLVGPSGCGKSTLLRMIAGLEEVSGGDIRIGERVVNDVAPKDRDIAMVFQSYALYPHMNVSSNMGFSLMLRKADEHDRVEDQEDKQKHGHRRGVALVQRFEGADIDVDRHRRGRTGRPALGHDEDEVGEGGDPDRAQHHRDGNRRRKEGQRHLGEALPGRGAVDGRRLMQFRRDRFQRRQQGDGEKRDAEPDIGDDRPPHGGCRVGQNVRRLRLQPQRVEPVRHGSDDRVEQPGPGEAGKEGRHRPGQEHQRLDNAAAGEGLVEQQRQAQSEEKLEEQAGDGPPGGVDQGLAQQRVGQHGLVLAEPDILRFEGGEFSERIADADDQRHQKHRHQKHDGRAEIEPRLERRKGQALAARRCDVDGDGHENTQRLAKPMRAAVSPRLWGRDVRQGSEGRSEPGRVWRCRPSSGPSGRSAGLPTDGEKDQELTSCSWPSSPAVPWSCRPPIRQPLPWPDACRAALPGSP